MNKIILNLLIFFLSTLNFNNAYCQSSKWELIGPFGGRVRSLLYDDRGSVLFAGTGAGGLFKTSTESFRWKSIGYNDLVLNNIRGRFIVDIEKINEKIFVCSDRGLLVSNTNRENWEVIFASMNGFATSVQIYPAEPNIIYLSFYGGGHGYFSNPGIYKSVDNGNTWYAINDGLSSTDVTQLVMFPTNKYKLFAATLGGIFRTDDGGESGWQNISGNLPDIPFTAIVIDSSDEKVIYAGSFNGVFKTNDGGQHWDLISTDSFKSKFVNLKALALSDSLLLVGTMQGLYKSEDGGLTWEEANLGLENLCIYSILTLNKNQIFVGTAEGIYISRTSGSSWEKISDQMNAYNVLALDFAKNNGEKILYIGTDGSGILKSDNRGEYWTSLNYSSEYLYVEDISVLKKNPVYIYASFIGNYNPKTKFAQSGVLRTTDACENWDKLECGTVDEFVKSIAVDPNNGSILYTGTNHGIYKSIDSGNNWLQSDSGRVGSNAIGIIVVDPFSSQTIYAGTSGGSIYEQHGIFKSIDGGKSWTFSSAGLSSAEFYLVTDIAINPKNSETIYTTLFGKGLFKSLNAGNRWEKIGTEILNDRLYSISIDPGDTNIVYAAGEKIYLSTNAGNSWQEIMDGVPENFGYVNEIRVDPNDPRYVYAATYGSGVLRLFRSNSGVNEDVQVIPETFALKQNYPNPFNPETRIEYSVAVNGHISLQIFNQRGQLIRTLVNEPQNPGSYMKTWDGKDELGNNVASGIYLYRLQAGKFSETKKMVKLQ